MNSATQLLSISGPVGNIDVALDLPSAGEPVRGVAVIAHPHPLFGGTRDNKVVQTLARALTSIGFVCWRPNFRGIGDTEGVHDEGRGETEDILAVVQAALTHESAPHDPQLLLAGFSFGSFVQTHVADRLNERGQSVQTLVLIAPAVSRFEVLAPLARTLIVHGETDDVVPLASVMDWARPHDLPIVVVPGADHFFHRRLPLLKRIVSEWVRGGG